MKTNTAPVERFGEMVTPQAPTLPTFDEAEKAIYDGRPTALDLFVYGYQPQNEFSALIFRRSLAYVLAEARR